MTSGRSWCVPFRILVSRPVARAWCAPNSHGHASMSMNSSPGPEPSEEEFREALRIERLPPREQMRHPSAIRSDQDKLAHVNTYGELPRFYIDRPFECTDCGRRQIWRASAQKRYYEDQKGHIDARAVRCRSCRKR